MDRMSKEELKEMRKQHDLERKKAEAKSSRMTAIAVWSGIIIILVLGVFAIVKTSGSSQTQDPSKPLADKASDVPAITPQDNVQGPANAKVTIIEYGDFQCPACGHYYPLVHQLLTDENGKIRFVFRNFPLTQLHPNAMPAARAAWAAGQQGKFWPMYDMLYQTQDTWAPKSNADAEALFQGYAKMLNLDTDKFKEDVAKKDADKFIQSQEDSGINLGVNSTPTFYLNNRLVTNPQSYGDLKKLVDDQLAAKPTPAKK